MVNSAKPDQFVLLEARHIDNLSERVNGLSRTVSQLAEQNKKLVTAIDRFASATRGAEAATLRLVELLSTPATRADNKASTSRDITPGGKREKK